jgi:hypothetical protein
MEVAKALLINYKDLGESAGAILCAPMVKTNCAADPDTDQLSIYILPFRRWR